MPQLVWQEVLFDFKVGAVVDLTPADGLLAQAALHTRIPYTGLVFTPKRADELLQRLQCWLIAGATREGDPWYDPHLVEAITKPKAKAKADATARTVAETRSKAKAKPKVPQAQGNASRSSGRRRKKHGSGEEAARTTTTKTAKAKAKAKADADTVDPFMSEHDEEAASEGEESSASEGI
jgi:hypothetical protein